MKKDYNELFDLKIKESLRDAEEKVPAGVWKNVSGRLSADSGSSFDWKRAGLVAVAAALCACFVLIGTFDRRKAESPSAQLQQVTVVTPADNPAGSVGQALAYVDTRVSSKPVTAPAAAATQQQTMETASAEQPTMETVAEDSHSPEPVSSETSKRGTDTKTAVPSYRQWDNVDDFEEETVEKVKGRGVSIDVKGSFSTNSSSLKLGTAGIQPSPVVETGVIEALSESSYGVPLTFGIGVRWYLGKRFSLGTGVDYTLLTRKFTGNYYPVDGGDIMLNADINHSLSYIGIPVNAYYDILQHTLVGLYVFGGAEIERAVANNYRIGGASAVQYYSEAVRGCQYSAQIGLGVEFKITDFLGVYIDPCLKFYFNSDQPTSMRTQQPLMFSAAIGLKFDLGK